jgi:hypothetical protein
MCKHILINDFSFDDIKAIKQFISLTHDNDGYGAIIRKKSGEIDTLKGLNPSIFYLELMEILYSHYDPRIKTIDSVVIHHRTSTNGQGLAYAHPFYFQGYHLTHNGVVNVPGKHDTKTTNDSEALLHHLLKTDFDTENIDGYFSVFMVSKAETIVIVDDTAPLYSDGRIFCSHNLGKDFQKIALRKIVIGKSDNPIKVKKSDYGKGFYSLSIGGNYSGLDSDYISDPFYWNDNPVNFSRHSEEIDDFISALQYTGEMDFFNYEMESAKSVDELYIVLNGFSEMMRMELSDQVREKIVLQFIEEKPTMPVKKRKNRK